MTSQIWDVAVIGAGAAGLMTSIQCAENGLKVILLDGQKTIGAKILMSGGTRCNVTNYEVSEKDYFSNQPRTVRNILRSYPSEKVVHFFEECGVQLLLEEEGKYFPATHSAKTILEALQTRMEKASVCLKTETKITKLDRQEDQFRMSGLNFEVKSRKIVITTGGLSYPGTGSDGTGYHLAGQLGHSIIPTTPALTPLLSSEDEWKELSGVSFPCHLRIIHEGKVLAQSKGAFLVTHFGFSGPAVLDISREWLRCSSLSKSMLILDAIPHLNLEELRQDWIHAAHDYPGRNLKGILSLFMPQRLAEFLLWRSDFDPELKVGQCPNRVRDDLLFEIKNIQLHIKNVYGYSKAEVTAGGIDLAGCDPKTLESKICPGLFFAGEILDVDGRIGGFNFQWAWSSAYAVSQGLLKSIKYHN